MEHAVKPFIRPLALPRCSTPQGDAERRYTPGVMFEVIDPRGSAVFCFHDVIEDAALFAAPPLFPHELMLRRSKVAKPPVGNKTWYLPFAFQTSFNQLTGCLPFTEFNKFNFRK